MKFLYILILSLHLCNLTALEEAKDCDPQEFPISCDNSEICHEGKCVDGCQNFDCGINAECTFDGFYSHFCNCLENYAGNPSVKCDKNPCESMPCGQNATCYIESNTVYCKCYENMIGDPFDKCWPIGEDICDPNPCGKNSRCIKEPEPGCLCLPGFYDKPPNCREGCEKDSQCADNQYCDFDYSCKVGCRSDEKCKPDEFCDMNDTRKCKIGCRSEENCKEKEICDLFTRTCRAGCFIHKHCNEGEFCDHKNNKCANPCDEPSPCGKNSSCKSVGHSSIVSCSCNRGYVPKPGVGCEKSTSNATQSSSTNLDCRKYCAKYAECNLVEKKLECRCPDEIFGEILNPFNSCLPSIEKPHHGFSHCAQAIKPECAVPLSPATIAALAG